MESTENSDVCLTLSSNGLQVQKFPSGVTIKKLASLMYRFDNWGVHAVES
jgi:hypothetical protein